MIAGIGMDVTPVARFETAAGRPGLLARLFTEPELDSSMQRMAGRFAAKEALIKALGGPDGLAWHDIEVGKDEAGRPFFTFRGSVAERIAERGIARVHLSITHDAGVAVAMVVCET